MAHSPTRSGQSTRLTSPHRHPETASCRTGKAGAFPVPTLQGLEVGERIERMEDSLMVKDVFLPDARIFSLQVVTNSWRQSIHNCRKGEKLPTKMFLF
jgi:hypothetical protein